MSATYIKYISMLKGLLTGSKVKEAVSEARKSIVMFT